MQRLQTLDLEFLAWEDARSPMNIGSLSIFEGPMPERDVLTGLFREVLRAHPHYRERLRSARLGLRAPVWIEDVHFALERHLHFVQLRPPGDDAALCELMGVVMAELLPRDRPLWECWIVDGLTQGRWAVIGKIHHALVDGQSGVALLTGCLDPEGGAPAAPRGPAADATPAALAADAPAPTGAGSLRRALRQLRALPAATAGVARIARGLQGGSATSIQGKVGTRRAFAKGAVALADVQRVRHAFGGTVNDVVLAVIAGALRSLMLQRGDDVTHRPIRALVPVSTRGSDGTAAGGNRIAAFLCDLPTHLDDPRARLCAVHAYTEELKQHSHMREGSEWLVRLGSHLPSALRWAATRAAGRLLQQLPQAAIATVATHVRGPAQPRFLRGRRLLACYPYVPIMQGARIGTAVLGYAGTLAFGITTDAETVPNPEVLAQAIGRELARLVALARDTEGATTAASEQAGSREAKSCP